jgi:hypothetical protein
MSHVEGQGAQKTITSELGEGLSPRQTLSFMQPGFTEVSCSSRAQHRLQCFSILAFIHTAILRESTKDCCGHGDNDHSGVQAWGHIGT